MLPLCVVGPVDHGKSSLVLRLARGPGADRIAAADTATPAAVRTARRGFRVLDARRLVDLAREVLVDPEGVPRALVVVDASADSARGVAALASLPMLGVRDVIVAVNKMDLVDWSEERYAEVRDAIASGLAGLGLHGHAFVPVCARDGGNVHARVPHTWWHGPTLVDAFDALPDRAYARGGPLRLPVRDVAERDGARVIGGRVESGSLKAGDDVLILTGNRGTRALALEGAVTSVGPGDEVRVVLADPLPVAPGDLVCSPDSPPKVTAVFDADLWWFGAGRAGEPGPAAGRRVVLRVGPREVGARIAAVHTAPDAETVSRHAEGAVRVTMRCDETVAVDDASVLPRTGRIVVIDGGTLVGAGLVDARGYPDQRKTRAHAGDVVPVRHQVVKEERASRAGHRGAVVWLTGLSGAGKSTLALALERRLFDLGWGVYTLDGDNVRTGLNADLGFSPEDRQENLRRVGEVAVLFADAGLVCVTAFISPYRDERARARTAAGSHPFIEVWVRSPLEECERRDPKGLYRKARAGKLKEFTGIDSPYEPPEAADLVVDTAAASIEACTAQLLDFVVATCRR